MNGQWRNNGWQWWMKTMKIPWNESIMDNEETEKSSGWKLDERRNQGKLIQSWKTMARKPAMTIVNYSKADMASLMPMWLMSQWPVNRNDGNSSMDEDWADNGRILK